jgi:hypothetical protein
MATYAYTFTSGDTLTPTKLNDARTISDIVNADIKSDAAIAGTKLADSAITTAKIADASSTTTGVTNAKLRHSAALSVVGRGANTEGAPADIAAANDNEVLRRSGTSVGFGLLATANVADASSTTTGVTNSKLRHSAALSVIGRSSNTDGAPADIAAGTDGHVLRRSGTSIGFGTLAAGAIADASLTAAKLNGVAKDGSGADLSVGTAPVFGCRAFVVCSANGTISSAGNVSSVRKTGSGSNVFTVDFATAMPDAHYAVSAIATYAGGNIYHARVANASTSSCGILFEHITGADSTSTDVAAAGATTATVRIAFFR